MINTYTPSRREILSEVGGGVKDKFKKESVSQFMKSSREFVKMYAAGTAFIVGMPYAIPTSVRVLRKRGEVDEVEINAKTAGVTGGVVTGLVISTGQLTGYGSAIREGYPEALLIPLATNIVSGIYEIGRKMYNNARQRVLEKPRSQGLEVALDSAEPPQE